MTSRIKITLDEDTRVVPLPKSIAEMQGKIFELFKDKIPFQGYRICYVDSEGDIISITNDSDYEVALGQKVLKFIVSPSTSASAIKVSAPKPSQENPSSPHEFVVVDTSPHLTEEKKTTESKPMEDISAKPSEEEKLAGKKEVQKIEVEEIKSKNKEPVQPEPKKIAEEQIQVSELYTCLYCKGSKTNKKGRMCKKCKGTGKMSKALVERVRAIVQNELSVMFESEIRSHTSQLLKSQQFNPIASQIPPSSIVHPGISCTNCGAMPIKGIRYQCSACGYYNLCENCEPKVDHPHSFYKIRSPSQKPPTSFPIVKEIPIPPSYMPEAPMAPSVPSLVPVYKIIKEEKDQIMMMRCLGENLKDKNEMAPGEEFEKVWTLENSGNVPWPKDTILTVDKSSDKLSLSAVNVGEVMPKATIEIKVKGKAPTIQDKYVSFLNLVGNNKKFGEHIWVEIIVNDHKMKVDKEEKKQPESKESLKEKTLKELTMKLSELKIPELYFDNMVQLLQIYPEYNADALYDLLQNNGNNVQNVCDFLLSVSQAK